MKMANGTHVFEQLMDPVARCLTPDVAKSLLQLRAPASAQARVEALADKCTAGALTAEEESEYDAYVWAGNLIAILQAKARTLLAEQN